MHEGTKKAMSQRTGRVASLPPSIYNNPIRMRSGQWILLNDDGTVPNQTQVIKKEVMKPRDPANIPDHIKMAMGIMEDKPADDYTIDMPEKTMVGETYEKPIENPIEAVVNEPKSKSKKSTK